MASDKAGALAAAAISGFALLCSCGQPDQPPRPTPSTAEAKLDFKALTFHAAGDGGAFEATTSGRVLRLLAPDEAGNPTVWDSALRITNAATYSQCAAEPWLVTDVYASSGADYLVVLSYSGSTRYIHFVESESCREKWSPANIFTEGITVAGDLVTVQPGCECPGGAAPCQCSAASVFQLAANRAPALLREQSLALTRSVLGVEFEGNAKVFRPKTPSAQLAGP